MNATRHCLSTLGILFKVFFPLTLLRWLLVLSLASWLFALILIPLSGWDWLNAIVVVAILITLLVGFVILPAQLIALASSRPIILLGNSRKKLLVALIAIGFLFSLAFYWLLNIVNQSGYLPSLLVIWLMISVLLQWSVWICSRWQGVHGFIFILNTIFVHVALWLDDHHPLMLLIALVASWAGFAYWWMRWRPVKYQSTNLILSVAELQKRRLERGGGLHVISGRARTWLGSRLLGAPDGHSARARRIGGALAMAMLFPIPFLFVMELEKSIAVIKYASLFFLIVMTLGVSKTIAGSFFRNMRCIWLYSASDRRNLFSLVWWAYWREILPWTAASIMLATALDLIFGVWRGAEILLLIIGSILLMQSLIFYLTWFIYQRTSAGFSWWSWVCSLMCLVWFFTAFSTGLLMDLPFEFQGISHVWLWAPELVAIAALHKKVRNGFTKMDLLRAA